ncbi:hypothetical protein IW140_002858 [Coemansia sp. RSA 1813]|nr:hypothetical protein LPJ74_002668 [Coemansia sp. RSA 1843]KAJ2569777.1 hypothetical protein IW140_002858 [Coemansia sp. RSA 1813]
MSKRNLEEQQTARLGHLHTASRMAFRICPQLAAFYGNEFCTALGSQKVANTIVRYQCPYCGSPLVDGRSVSRVSVVRSQRGASNSCGKKNKKIQPKKRSRKKSKTGNDCKRRVIKIWLSDTANAHQPKMTKEELADAQKNMKNTVEYICQLCDSRIVFPGTTVSGLDAAGLAGDLTTTETSSRINDGVAPAMTKEPIPPASPRISPGSIRIEAEATTSNKHTPNATKTAVAKTIPKTTVAQSKTVTVDSRIADAQSKKRKRYKSNLLATVTANKKKADEKKNNSSFNLNDFLSNL